MSTQHTIRAENVERAALADIHRAASPDLREGLGLDLEEIGGALVSFASRSPTILVNRTVGLGLAHPSDRKTVDTIVETLDRTNLGSVEVGSGVNLERAMPASGRFDGHVHRRREPL